MKTTKINKQKGITLIALVITIIVLLILSGVAISMLSGENGILNKAAKAKEDTEKAQKEEESRLSDYEVIMDFSENNTPYKFSNGYLTGINIVEFNTVNFSTEKVEEVNLPSGYEIFSYNEETKEYKLAEKNENMKTGMIIKKDGKKIGQIIVYGDIYMDDTGDIVSDGKIITHDKLMLAAYINNNSLSDIDKIAGDVNHDGVVNWIDVNRIERYVFLRNLEKKAEMINQNKSIKNANDIKVETYEESKKNWVNGLNDTIKANFEWQEEEESYIYKISENATAETILANMPGAAIVNNRTILKNGEEISDGDKIMLYPDFDTTSSTYMFEIGQIKLQE